MKRCPECHRKHEDEVLTCDCGADLTTARTEDNKKQMGSRRADPVVGNIRYPVLRFMVVAFYGVGLMSITAGTILMLQSLSGSLESRLSMAGAWYVPLVVGLVGGLLCVLVAESIRVGLDIENNTRLTAQFLRTQIEVGTDREDSPNISEIGV